MARHVILASAAPSEAPEFVGQHYIQEVAEGDNIHYLANGTSDVADWQEVGAGGGGGSVTPANVHQVTLTMADDNTTVTVPAGVAFLEVNADVGGSDELTFSVDLEDFGNLDPTKAYPLRVLVYRDSGFADNFVNLTVANGTVRQKRTGYEVYGTLAGLDSVSPLLYDMVYHPAKDEWMVESYRVNSTPDPDNITPMQIPQGEFERYVPEEVGGEWAYSYQPDGFDNKKYHEIDLTGAGSTETFTIEGFSAGNNLAEMVFIFGSSDRQARTLTIDFDFFTIAPRPADSFGLSSLSNISIPADGVVVLVMRKPQLFNTDGNDIWHYYAYKA